MKPMTKLQFRFKKIVEDMNNCQYKPICRSNCPFIPSSSLPIPDYLGPLYDIGGIIIVASNPGPLSSSYAYCDGVRDTLFQNLGNSTSVIDYKTLRDFLRDYMKTWKNRLLVNMQNQCTLNYDIERIAFINLVKCRTIKTWSRISPKVQDKIAKQCWEAWTEEQINLLNPGFIFFQWKGTEASFKTVCPYHNNFTTYSYNGSTAISKSAKSQNNKFEQVFKAIYSSFHF